MAATMTRIAKEAGVSVAVVSRLLRGDPTLRISNQRRQLILNISDRCGGVRARKNNRTLTKTVLMPINRKLINSWTEENIIRSPMYRAAEGVLQDAGFILNFTLIDHDQRVEQLEAMIRSGTMCDGLLISSGMVNEEMGQLLRARRFPHVSWSLDAERYQVCTVCVHAGDGIRQAVEHLRGLGHEHIGFFGTRRHPRYPMVVANLVSAGLPVNEHYSCWMETANADPNPQELQNRAAEVFADWLDRNTWPSAFLCSNDALALAATKALLSRGEKLGGRISIVGFDNIEEQGEPPASDPILTTIDSPFKTIGTGVAQLLLNQIMYGQSQVVHQRIPTRLIVRKSTGPVQR